MPGLYPFFYWLTGYDSGPRPCLVLYVNKELGELHTQVSFRKVIASHCLNRSVLDSQYYRTLWNTKPWERDPAITAGVTGSTQIVSSSAA